MPDIYTSKLKNNGAGLAFTSSGRLSDLPSGAYERYQYDPAGTP